MSERISGVVEANKAKHFLFENLTKAYAEVLPAGSANLQKAREIQEAGGKLVLVANHLSNADAPVIALAVKKLGFGDLERKLVFLLGQKLINNKFTRYGINAYSYIPVWPPTMVPRTEEERRMARRITESSLKSARSALDKGRVLTIFPEGTRSRTKALADGVGAIANYLDNGNIYVVPVGIYGTEQVLPVGSFLPSWAAVGVNFGEPFSFSERTANLKSLPRSERKVRGIDMIMTEVALLIPPEYRGAYSVEANLAERLSVKQKTPGMFP